MFFDVSIVHQFHYSSCASMADARIIRRNMQKTGPFLHGFGIFLAFLFFAQGIAAATELTKDDIDFRKAVYAGKNNVQMPYRLFVPLGYDANRKYPLVFWLHGIDGRGSDNLKQITKENELGSHFWISSEVQLKFPVFVFAPQCPFPQNWSEPELNRPSQWLLLAMDALARVEKDFSIDQDRVYIVGQSMGGLGVWSLLQNYRGRWAAAIVMCAFDNFLDVPAIAEVPLWVFQGDADRSVPVTTVRSMMAELKKAHAKVRYTEYHKSDHDVWNKAFAEPDLLSWLSTQKRSATTGSQVGSGAAAPSQ
jgi:predicted peptidase